mmetsp:Transcript_16103/g.33481  ORF Transcript_16103/g.33481 Transcript_16103/m.33481 type:complete len:462 (-) Transcript_16103:1197-2582(-)
MSDSIPDSSDPPHPDSILRLASAVHRFRIPLISPEDHLSFEESFKSCSEGHKSTKSVMIQADLRRDEVKQAMAAGKLPHATLSQALKEYIPLLNQVLISCKVQPESARLDKRLLFSWCSGIEYNKTKKPSYFKSEALMFELVLSISTYALSEANLGCDACMDGDFPAAARNFAKTAGGFKYLGEDLLPSWMAKSQQHAKMENEALAETRVGVCVAFTSLFTAMAQQMAVATILIKPGVPNYSLVGKLCLGIAEDLDSFVSILRSKSSIHMSRMDPSFLTLITFEINVQKALGLYFLARSLWSSKVEYGLAIAALSEATVAMRTRSSPTGRGIPEIDQRGPLQSLVSEIDDFRQHMVTLLKSWERDNSLVYFDKVPPSVPSSKALKAIQMNKTEEFVLEVRDPLPLGDDGSASFGSGKNAGDNGDGPPPPSYDAIMMDDTRMTGRERSDSDLARELDKHLNS